MIKLSVVCCVIFLGGVVVADNVPALIWGAFNHYTPALALKSYNVDEFIDILSEHVKPETFTLIISENQLSTEDLSQCRTPTGKTCFEGIQQLKSKLYLPSVEDPVAIIEDVAGADKTEVTLLSNGALSEPLNPEGGKYVFVNFEDDASDDSKVSRLTRHDKIITKLYTELTSQDINVMVIYTGRRAEHQKRVVRQVASSTAAAAANTSATTSATPTTAAAPVAPAPTQPKQTPAGIFWQRDRLLIYYTGLESVDSTGVATEIEITNVTLTELGEKIGVTMTSSTGTALSFNITGESGYWWLHEFAWGEQPILSDTRIAAVEFFSFHCSPAITLSTFNKNVLLRWHGLQIQPEFGTVAEQTFNSFGDSWDCVGFVSPGIVGGLFVVIMLLFILSIGISWMMDINTMDRFDDPKGKTITISVNE